MSAAYKVAVNVTCHAWSPDRKQIALCPNSEEVLIYSSADKPFEQWKLEHTLKGHDLVVSSIDWSPVHNKIVTCSHDRNAFVWTLAGSEWKPSLSILRINRAALSVKWSPDGKKFAVASGAKVVPVCHYEAANDWWISKMIKKHKSTVLDVSWHPNSQLLATASSDFRARVFSAFIEGVDSPTDSPFGSTSSHVFGDALAEYDSSNGWVEGVSWSPNGKRLAFVGHDSTLSIVDLSAGGDKPRTTVLKEASLPSTQVLFLSDNVVVTGGHAYTPLLYQDASGSGKWVFLGEADTKQKADAGGGAKKAGGITAARSMWQNKTVKGQESEGSGESEAPWTTHVNAIVDVKPYGDTQWSTQVDAFSTAGIDGNIVVWRARDLKNHLKDLKL